MNHNGVVGHYPPGMPGQKFDDFIFNLGQVDVPAVYPDQSFVKIYCQPASRISLGTGRTVRKRSRAAAGRTDAGQKL